MQTLHRLPRFTRVLPVLNQQLAQFAATPFTR